MKTSESKTIEQVLFDGMGISVEDALATGIDVLDAQAAAAVDSGIDVQQRLTDFGQLLEKLTDPIILKTIGQLLESLPQLAQLANYASELPNIVATLVDVVDDYQQHCSAEGIDLEKAIVNGFRASIWLASQIENEHLQRIGELLRSDILNPHAVNVVNNAAQSLTSAQEIVGDGAVNNRIGIFGLLAALRKPEIQRSLAFAVRFGERFGKNLEAVFAEKGFEEGRKNHEPPKR